MNYEELPHSGFVGLVGRPNVGKSTLINQLVKRKLAIVSNKPQTTRHQIRAVVNQPEAQIVFIDTPGWHKPKDSLGRHLNRKVRGTMAEVDVILFLLDGAAGIGTGDAFIAKELVKLKTAVVPVLNKIDIMTPSQVTVEKGKVAELSGGEVFAVSGATGKNLGTLLSVLTELLPPGPRYYPEGMMTDQPEKMLMAELIREKAIEVTREEMPYALAVEVYEVRKRPGKSDLIDVYARIHVERNSQKGIVIGSGGKMLETIGSRARVDIENLLGSRIYLDLIVSVTKDWRRQNRKIEELGY